MTKMSKRVALLGSSGGGTATLGHTDARNLIETIALELESIGATLTIVYFVAAAVAFDSITSEEDEQVVLYYYRNGTLDCEKEDLRTINEQCTRRHDKALADKIQQGEIDAIVCISCNATLFDSTFRSAKRRQIPITGSGGTSLSLISAIYGLRLVGNAGGSVASTTYTRAVSYTSALSSHWNIQYRPWRNNHRVQQLPSITSVLNSALPIFWGVCLCKRIIQVVMYLHEEGSEYHDLYSDFLDVLENYAVPVACASLMVVSRFRERIPVSSLVLATTLAASGARASIFTALSIGLVITPIMERLMFLCIFNNIPATMTNLLMTGGTGAVLAVLASRVSAPLSELSSHISWAIRATVSMESGVFRTCAGFLWGVLSCYGSKVGLYHSVMLPLILIEMEKGDPSFLGAVDELTLVLVCAGICSANMVLSCIFPTLVSITDFHLCRRGMYVNLAFGDFVEVCYPYMKSNAIINFGGYLASGISCAVLVADADSPASVPRSSAYLPLPVSVFVAGENWEKMIQASTLAFGISFSFTVLGHSLHGGSKISEKA